MLSVSWPVQAVPCSPVCSVSASTFPPLGRALFFLLDVRLESTNLQHWPQLIKCTLSQSRVSKCALQIKVKCIVQQQQGDATPHQCPVMDNTGTSWRGPVQYGKGWKCVALLGAEGCLHGACTPAAQLSMRRLSSAHNSSALP